MGNPRPITQISLLTGEEKLVPARAVLIAYTDFSKSNNLNMPWANLTELEKLYPTPSKAFPSGFNASAGIWRDAHMLCLVHNLATERTRALRLPVWRYRFDLVADNLNSLGRSIGAFHGEDIRFVMGQWRLIELSPPFIPATPEEIRISDIMVEAWTNFIKGKLTQRAGFTAVSLIIVRFRSLQRTANTWLEEVRSERWNVPRDSWDVFGGCCARRPCYH